jgi:hypothetical protein
VIGLDETTVLDFWRWGMSELRTNTLRGVMAEFIVSKAVGATAPGRIEWDPYDVVTPGGVRLEVKCGAYLQSWSQQRLSRIEFGGLSARLLDESVGTYVGDRGYNADVYVFAVQTATSHDMFDVLDTRQWEFYVVSRCRVEATGYRSLSLATVRTLTDGPVPVSGLSAKVARVHEDALSTDGGA